MTVPFFQFRDFPVGLSVQAQKSLVQAYAQKEYVLGQEVREFEIAFAQYLRAGYVIGVGNGFDALVLSLKALGICPGDEVILPANGYAATLNAVLQAGATPVLVEPHKAAYTLEAAQVAKAIGPKTKVVLPTHLYGQPCFMPDLVKVAQKQGAFLIEDCAQAHGARILGNAVGTFGSINAFSFYPTKNLGAVGDAGAVVTATPEIAAWVQKYRNYGQSSRYVFDYVGINSRLDSLQAAVLSVKLSYLDQLNAERKRLAAMYDTALAEAGDIQVPWVRPGVEHVYHLYVIRTSRRDALQQFLERNGISTFIHYPVPPHLQPAYRHLGYQKGDFPITEELAATSLSLPLFPGMTEAEQTYIIEQVQRFFA